MKLVPYQKEGACPKCGWEVGNVKYCEAEKAHVTRMFYTIRYPATPEHLKLTCKLCGYSWDMEVKDASTDDVGDGS